jgi:CubicO group peptidase (beta-lactamase class C family)
MRKIYSKKLVGGLVFIFAMTFCVFAQNGADKKNRAASIKSTGGDKSSIVRGELGSALDEYMRRLEGYGFSGSLLVEKDGAIYLSKGYGLADRQRSIPVTADTAFYGASLAKQFTAAAVMLLEQQGKLRVEDSITKYFDDVPEDKKSITLHQMLTHSAGFPNEFSRSGVDYYKNPDEFYYKDRDEYIRAILAAPLDYPPGSRSGYSNAGFSLIAAIVEKVSGRSYRSFVRENFFIPAGLTRTGFGEDAKKWNRAAAKGFNGSVEIPHSYEADWGVIGAGGIFTSVTDLYKWELALRGDKILNEAKKAELFGARVPSGSVFDYAYGWRAQKSSRGTNIIWASGLEPEFSAMFQRYVDENVTIIFMSNNSLDGFPFRDVLVVPGRENVIDRIVFGKDYTLPPWFAESKSGSLEKYAGTYKTAAGDEFIVSIDKNALRLAPRSQPAADLLIPPMTDVPAPDYAKYRGEIEKALETYQSGNKDEAYKQIRFDGEKLEKRYGRFLGVERMVTVPVYRSKGMHRATTYAELKFEREIVSYRWHWWDGELYERHEPRAGKQLAILPPFRQQSPNEFVTYHIFLGLPLRIKFEIGAGESVRSLTIVAAKGGVKAEKFQPVFQK